MEKAFKDELEKVADAYTPKYDYSQKYAENISKTGWSNMIRLGLWVPKADTKARDKIKKGKSPEDKIIDAIKESKDSGEEKEEKKKDKDDGH